MTPNQCNKLESSDSKQLIHIMGQNEHSTSTCFENRVGLDNCHENPTEDAVIDADDTVNVADVETRENAECQTIGEKVCIEKCLNLNPSDCVTTEDVLSPWSPDGPDLVKLVVLGAASVGKTSLIHQFVWGSCPKQAGSTVTRETYYPSIVVHGKLHRVKIIDSPILPYFPVSSTYNIKDLQKSSLYEAQGFLLVYDVTCSASFSYLVQLRNQMDEANKRGRGRASCLVVANKIDLDISQQNREKEVRVVRSWGYSYTTCCAKDEASVMDVFKAIMLQIMEDTPQTHGCPNYLNNCTII